VTAENANPPTPSAFLDGLRQFELLTTKQWEELRRGAAFADTARLAQHLVSRGWLTRFQTEELLLGRGAELILGQYCLLEPLGGGGMGQVFKARHRLMHRVVALKVIRSDLLSRPEAVQRFRREIQLAAQFNHAHIISAYDAEQIGERHCLVMEYAPGRTLAELVRQVGPLPVGQACACMCQAALGLQHAHERGLIHRDIKPENLLLSQGIVKILDFGLARLCDPLSPQDKLTRLGTVLGTPDFMAPEQVQDLHAADARSDLYSVGCTFYFLLAGRVPFLGGTPEEKMLRHRLEDPSPLERLRADVPDLVRGLVSRLMAKDPAQRFQTAGELAAALRPLAPCQGPVTELLAPAEAAAPAEGWSSIPVATYQTRVPMPRRPVEAPEPGPTARKARWRRAVAACGLGLLPVVALWFLLRPQPPEKVEPVAVPTKPSWNWRPGPKETLKRSEVRDLALSPDGNRLALAFGHPTRADVPGEVQLWEVAPDRLTLRKSWPRPASVTNVAFSSDGKLLAYGGAAPGPELDSVTVHNVEEDREVISFKGHRHGILSLAFSSTGRLFTGGRDKVIGIWEVPSGKSLGALKGHANSVTGLALSADGQTLVSNDRVWVWVWDVSGPGKRRYVRPWTGPVRAAAITRDGKTVAAAVAASKDTPAGIQLGDTSTDPPHFEWLQQGVAAQALVFTPDGSALLAAHADRTIRLWNRKNGLAEVTLEGHLAPVHALALSDGGSVLVSISSDQTVGVWLRVDK
jgi:WD40 repeat protein/tRNA A-37 threonylcarbamoyl transferase component Bud32